jgi:peptidoglycan/xylan/chitin deacetylase (PgdA/CDA1 family)
LHVLPWAGFGAAASYTFDDAQPSQVDHFAALEATGVPVTYYITSSNNWYGGFVETFRAALAGGSELGNHTVHHCNSDLSGCDDPLASAEAELDQCTAYIEDELGAPAVLTVAYPFGDLGYRTASQARFFLGRGVRDGSVGAGDDTDPFDLPVKAAAGGEGAAVWRAHLDDALAGERWVIFLFHSLLPNAQNWFAGVDVAAVTASIEHAQSLGDVWVDSVAAVGAYWLGQKLLQDAEQSTAGETITWVWQLPASFPSGRFVRVRVDGGSLRQGQRVLAWDGHGYYEVALDAGSLSWSP